MTEENVKSLYERLTDLQVELKAPKNQFNSFGKYRYRSAEDILEAVKPLTQKHGLTFTISDEPVMVGDRIYIKSTAKIRYKDQYEQVTAFARESLSKKGQDESQITGTASSYARKYAMNGLFLIDDTKDSDSQENGEETKNLASKQTNSKPVNTKQNVNQNNNQPNKKEPIMLDKSAIETIENLITIKQKSSGKEMKEFWLDVTNKVGFSKKVANLTFDEGAKLMNVLKAF